MCCGSKVGSFLGRIASCIVQLKAQGPSRTCDEGKEEKETAGNRTWRKTAMTTFIIMMPTMIHYSSIGLSVTLESDSFDHIPTINPHCGARGARNLLSLSLPPLFLASLSLSRTWRTCHKSKEKEDTDDMTTWRNTAMTTFIIMMPTMIQYSSRFSFSQLASRLPLSLTHLIRPQLYSQICLPMAERKGLVTSCLSLSRLSMSSLSLSPEPGERQQ